MEERITIKSVRIDLGADPDFPKSAVARRLKAIGGKYSECRGNQDVRYVHAPLGTTEGVAVLDELMLLRQANTRQSSLVFECSVATVRLDGFAHKPHALNVMYFEPGTTTAETAIAAQKKRLERWALSEIDASNGTIGWANDETIKAKLAENELAQQRTIVENLRSQLATAEAKLALLEGK